MSFTCSTSMLLTGITHKLCKLKRATNDRDHLQSRNLEPNIEEKWRYWVPARFVNSIEGWKSVEEIDKRADYVLPCHDEAVGDHDVYPFEGMKLRKRREIKSGLSFYFSGIKTKK